MAGSAAHKAASKSSNEAHGTAIDLGTIPSLNTMVAQDHRGGKQSTRPLLGCKAFHAAQGTFTGVDLLHHTAQRAA